MSSLIPIPIPAWVLGAALMILVALVLFVIYRWFTDRFARLAARKSPFLHDLLQRSEGPASALVVILGLGTALPAADLPPAAADAVGHALLIVLVLSLGWAASKAINLGADLTVQHLTRASPDEVRTRRYVTQTQILRRAANVVIVIVTIAVALMTMSAVRQFGLSLFASAGAAGLVLGLAARPVLSNLLAGIQIALTQPIRLEDAVIVEGEWGWIETITSTYVVVRIWDLRRIVLPLSYFIEKPFQNWTYASPELLGSVYLNVDYTVPVDEVRHEVERIAHASELWDGKVTALQVTGTPGNMVELRALVSARNAGDAWNLRCEVREKLIAFLQTRYPSALPRQRAEFSGTFPAIQRPDGDGALSPSQNRAKRPAARRSGV